MMKVTIHPYNPEWKRLYEDEKVKIFNVCGNVIQHIGHIGSTSVPGLGAKPIIDIMTGLKVIEDSSLIIPKLQKLGYNYQPDQDFFPNHKYLSIKGKYHIHLVETNSEFWKRHLLFRDYLRYNNYVREEYYKLKMELSKCEWKDGNEFADAKTDFIRKTESEAYRWFTQKTEETEANAYYDMYSSSSESTKKNCGLKFMKDGHIHFIRTDVYPRFGWNHVTGAGLYEEIDEILVKKIIDFYTGSNSIFSIQLVPEALNSETEQLLNRNNFQLKNYWVRLYRDTSEIENVKSSLGIKEINENFYDEFTSTITGIFGMDARLKGLFEGTLPSDKWIHYAAFEGDQLAGTGSVYLDGDFAYIGNAATKPEYRNRGSQGLLLKTRIEATRLTGCRFIAAGVWADTPEYRNPSYHNMLRYGFRELYRRANFVYTKD